MSAQFKLFLSQLCETNATLDYFTDFRKIVSNIHKIEINLTQLNYLIGKSDLEKAIDELYSVNPKVFEVLDILIAVRKKDNKKIIHSSGSIIALDTFFIRPQPF